MQDIADELQDVVDEIQAIVDEEGDGSGSGDGNGDGAQRQNVPTNAQVRGGNPLAAFSNLGTDNARGSESPYASMEYRQAFMSYVQRGTAIPAELLSRAGGEPGTTVAADIGAIIPETIMSEFIKEVSKVYGNIYAKVRKLNVKGGVKYPISKLKASFKWVTETTVSENQKTGDINDFITFDYNVGEIRLAQTLLSQVVSLPVFESEIVKLMIEAYVEAMDKGIIAGTGEGQLLGITKDPRVTNVIEMTEAEFSDWTAWRKKLFAAVPLKKRGQGEFLFAASTVESYLMTMKDANDRPLFKEATELSMGNTAGKFFGRVTDLVEPDVISDFATAAEGDVVGIFWVPNDYAINTNLQFGMQRYFDHEKNEWINKGLTIVDGKILDTTGCYLIKKSSGVMMAAATRTTVEAVTATATTAKTATTRKAAARTTKKAAK